MSEPALAPTAANFDAIVAAKSAALEAKTDAPDTQEVEHDEIEESDPEEVEEVDEPESSDDDSLEDDEESDEEQDNDPTREPVEKAMAAPFKAFRASIKDGVASDEFQKAIAGIKRTIQTVNGPVTMTYGEMDGHVMREARFSREMAKTKEDQARAQNIIQIEQARTNAWRQNPAELERGLEVMGCTAALEHVFMNWAREKYAFLNATPEQREQIQRAKVERAQRAQEQMRYAQMERELLQLKQQNQAQQWDEPTRQAGDYINKNLDSALGAALKKANAGRISDPARQDMINELTALCQQGVPLPQAMKEAAEITADRYAERRELAQAQNRQAAKAKPEVSGRRAPAGNAPPRRDDQGRFQPPTRSSNGSSKRRKEPPTAASFGERFGV
jgi:hypothetical protein